MRVKVMQSLCTGHLDRLSFDVLLCVFGRPEDYACEYSIGVTWRLPENG